MTAIRPTSFHVKKRGDGMAQDTEKNAEFIADDERNRFIWNEEDVIARRIEKKYQDYKYEGGYTGSDGKLLLKCRHCGYVFQYTAQIIRPSRNNTITCRKCREVEDIKTKELEKEKANIRQAEAISRSAEKAIRDIEKEKQRKASLENHICINCGIKFTAHKMGIHTCSDKCKKQSQNRYKEIRKKQFKKNGGVDNTITLQRLIKRDKGKCKICGDMVNENDFRYDENQTFIVGKDYPSIDHIKPRATGGTHTWDNVQLAHLICNSKKNANSVYETMSGQMRMSV